ncbi:hypothetical protein ABG79_00465 [Caloramator mitchellensis]|uniref:Putative restriction endonuclease domain-containing protein n=1 Tax=Caloramator mitchellensis TaxID=908809 RepID=A0A0R3JVQ7_CALMK|nr:Uma2 family endonuclease [Caloramator mitchellensis]KRQ87664.1 hypothetical protein ABG79_00465 [Caloramator mitchellensis]
MGESAKKIDRKFTYRDYLNTKEGENIEIIDGIIYNMVAPSRIHQEVSMNFSRIISTYLLNKECRAYAAPFDVRFIKEGQTEDEIDCVVQPDISIICDKTKLDDKGCLGAPDMIIEIVSPSSASVDYIRKLNLYEKHKVKEYWIVNPVDKIVMVFILSKNGEYGKPFIYSENDLVKVNIFDDLNINLKEIFNF